MKPTQTEIERLLLAYHPHECVKMNLINGNNEIGLFSPLDAINIEKDGYHKIEHIELRSIDSLTDEEVENVAKILALFRLPINMLFAAIKTYLNHPSYGDRTLEAYDYLRSIEIAVPFAGYTVEQWKDFGILKIKG